MNLWCLRIAYYITYTKKLEAAKVESGVTKLNVGLWGRLLNCWCFLLGWQMVAATVAIRTTRVAFATVVNMLK